MIDPNKPMVALTFDDGPHPTNTPQLINLLQHYDFGGDVFMQESGREISETTLMVINSASEAASHSYNHPKLTKLKGDNLLFQLNRTTETGPGADGLAVHDQAFPSALRRGQRDGERKFSLSVDHVGH